MNDEVPDEGDFDAGRRRGEFDDITPEEIDMLTGLFTRVSERLDSDTPCP